MPLCNCSKLAKVPTLKVLFSACCISNTRNQRRQNHDTNPYKSYISTGSSEERQNNRTCMDSQRSETSSCSAVIADLHSRASSREKATTLGRRCLSVRLVTSVLQHLRCFLSYLPPPQLTLPPGPGDQINSHRCATNGRTCRTPAPSPRAT